VDPSVSRADAIAGSPDPDLRDRLVEAGMSGAHAYYLATIADSAANLWRLVTGVETVEQDGKTYEPRTLASTVARLEDVDAEGHSFAYDGCVAVIDVGARGKDYRCGSGGYANKLLCGTHQDTNSENLRTVFDEDAPEDLRIDDWPAVEIGDDRFLAVEQRDGDLLAISVPEYEYRQIEGFGHLDTDAGAGRDEREGNRELTDTDAGDLQEASSEEIGAEPKVDDGQTWVEVTDDGTEEHTSAAPEPAFLDEHPEGSLVRVDLEDGRVYTGEVIDHGTGGWRDDARSLYIDADAVRGSLMVYCDRQDDGSWGTSRHSTSSSARTTTLTPARTRSGRSRASSRSPTSPTAKASSRNSCRSWRPGCRRHRCSTTGRSRIPTRRTARSRRRSGPRSGA
jgi:hypothetical protein